MTDVRLIHGDCLAILSTLEAGSVDAVVTDPPAGIEFMGKEWDSPDRWKDSHSAFGFRGSGVGGVANRQETRNPNCRRCRKHVRGSEGCRCPEGPDSDEDLEYRQRATARKRQRFVAFLTAALAECFRVAKPGARLLCWALPRTSHWTGTAVEDAGWVIEDRISHLFGQGFPKHKSKLKPACEDWWLAIKPDRKATPLNIDQCRIAATDNKTFAGRVAGERSREQYRTGTIVGGPIPTDKGRWPANVVLSHREECVRVGTRRVKKPGGNGEASAQRGGDGPATMGPREGRRGTYYDADGMEEVEAYECHPECPIRLLDEQSGMNCGTHGGGVNRQSRVRRSGYALTAGVCERDGGGGESRFFYCPKASKSDRGEGNTHPTVKSLRLMEYLIRLITPPGGVVLDPFAGSGSTGVAAVRGGYGFIGCEQNPEYFAIGKKRMEATQRPLLTEAAS